MAHAAADLARIFAANRAVGAVALAVRSSGGMTRRARLREEGSLRVRCPGPASAELEAVIVNTAGGVAGGDRLKLDVSVEGGARLAVTTAAAEKIYRALVMRPRLLLLDEPTEGIQPSIIKDIGRAIAYLRNLGQIAVVLVEQYLDFARELGDHFAVMDRGAIVYSCSRDSMDEAALRRAMAI